MKKGIIYICLCSLALLFVIILDKKKRDFDVHAPTPTPTLLPTQSLLPMLTEPEYSDEDEREQTKTSEPSVKMYLLDYVSQYSQVVNKHFYFLRKLSGNSYVLYRDQAEEILNFSLQDGELRGFAIYNSQYFVLIRTKTGTLRLGVVDIANKSIRILCDVYASREIDCIILYHNCLYICEDKEKRIERQTVQGEMLEPITFSRKTDKSQFDIQGIFWQEDLYYLELNLKGEIILNRRSLQGTTETVISCPCPFVDVAQAGRLNLEEITETYVYFSYGHYGEGRVGRISLNDKKLEIKKIETSEFDYTTQYVFFVDRRHNVWRIGWGENKRQKCGMLKVSEISCPDDQLYVKAYTKETELLEDSEDVPAENWSDGIYCMNSDGKECRKIYDEKSEWMN